MSPKGVPHIFEYAVGPGVFALDPAKPEKGKVVPLTRRAELYGLLKTQFGLSIAENWILLLCFSPSRMFLSSLLSFLKLQS